MSSQAAGDYQSIELVKSNKIARLMKQRHISDTEVKLVIHHGETTGDKLYNPVNNRFLSKMKHLKAMFYVEYSVSDSAYVVHTLYAHKSKILEDS